jgi:hypothetical protein
MRVKYGLISEMVRRGMPFSTTYSAAVSYHAHNAAWRVGRKVKVKTVWTDRANAVGFVLIEPNPKTKE